MNSSLPNTDPSRELVASEANLTDQTLMRRFRDGEQDAASALYLRYAGRLQTLANHQTSDKLSLRLASDEIVQSVFRTFFRRVSDGQYSDVDGDDLWRLFLVIALNKIRSSADYHQAKKRDVRKTVAGDDLIGHQPARESEQSVAYAVLKMTIDELLETLPESHREIVRLRIDGHTLPEVAAKTGRALRSTERILQEFRQRLLAIVQE